MRKYIITIGLAVVVASSSAYGFGKRDGQGYGDNFPNNHKRGGILSSNKIQSGIYSFMSAISNLNLSNTQKTKIREVMFKFKQNKIEQRENTKTSTITFDENGNFKKEFFIQNRTKISQKMITKQANMVENILNILNDDQKDTITKKLSKQVQ